MRRRRRARREGEHTVLYGLGTFGLVGWAVMVPTLIGISLGVWLDTRDGSRISFTLTGLIVGVVAGCLNAWYWVQRRSEGP